jgi:hypothetical protein
MGYVIAAIVVLLLVAGFVTFFVLGATRRSNPAKIAAPDEAPLGDTTEHSGATTPEDRSGVGRLPRVGDPGPEAGEQERRRAASRRG